jgi:hypothetical protein
MPNQAHRISDGEASHVQERQANDQNASHQVPELAKEVAEGKDQGPNGEAEVTIVAGGEKAPRHDGSREGHEPDQRTRC